MTSQPGVTSLLLRPSIVSFYSRLVGRLPRSSSKSRKITANSIPEENSIRWTNAPVSARSMTAHPQSTSGGSRLATARRRATTSGWSRHGVWGSVRLLPKTEVEVILGGEEPVQVRLTAEVFPRSVIEDRGAIARVPLAVIG